MANSYNELFGLGSHSEDSALELYLKLQETTGTVAQDSSSNNVDGTINGMGSNPITATGPNNWLTSCFDFDGSNDYVSLAPSFPAVDTHTIMMFIKTDNDPSASTASSGLGTFGEAGASSGANHYPFTDGIVYLGMLKGVDASTVARAVCGNPTPALTSWRQFCVKCEPLTGNWKFRLDGTQIAQSGGVSGLYTSGNYYLGRSTDQTANSYYLDGKVAGLCHFSRLLTDAEEAQFFAGPEPLNTAVPTLTMTSTTWSGTVGTWNAQSNGTVTYAWELRLSSNNSVVESGTGSSPSGSGSYASVNHYLWVRASNDGGFDSGQDSVSTAANPGGTPQVVNAPITFVSTVSVVQVYGRSVTSAMTLVSDGSAILDTNSNEVTSTLSMSSVVSFFNVIEDRQVPESVLALVSTVSVEGLVQGVGHVLSLSSLASATVFADENIVSSVLTLTGVATAVYGVPTIAIPITHELGLTHSISTSVPQTVESTLALTDEAICSYGFESVLSLVSTVSGGISRDFESEMDLVQAVSTAGSEWVRALTSTLSMTSAAGGYEMDDKCARRNSPTGPIGSGLFTMRSGDGQYEITLRNPEVDNVRRSSFDRILRETRGGKLTIYRDSSWNVVQTLLFTFVALKRTTLDDLQTFFLNTLGNEITLIDWLGEEWSGVITKPDETFTEDREGAWTFSFEFEGTKTSSHSGSHYLNLSQVVSSTLV